jgi:rod shape-determining protein MreB
MFGLCAHCDIAIDVGTSAIRIASPQVREHGFNSAARKPMACGVVADSESLINLLNPLLDRARARRWWSHPRVLACAPTDASADEKQLLHDCLRRAGAARVFLSPEPLAAAIGAGIDVGSDYAKLIVDLGEGVTDSAVIRSARVVCSHAVRKGCSDLREAIRAGLLRTHQLAITDAEAQRLLNEAGMTRVSAGPDVMVRNEAGTRDITISMQTVRAACAPVIDEIIAHIVGFIRDLPAQLVVEIIEDGLFLTGGGALLPGVIDELGSAARVQVQRVPDPLHAVVLGAREMLPLMARLELWQ